ncbi:MAG: hypothetical protein K2M37_08010 [Muribaculaceae bacterium]|nr:hypothetical protein [Muribaculaceae bacterium]
MEDFFTYAEQLEKPEWQRLRLKIIERDGQKCQLCGKGKSVSAKFDNKIINFGIDYSLKICADQISDKILTLEEFKQCLNINWIRCMRNGDKIIAVTSNNPCGFLVVKDDKNIPPQQDLMVRLIGLSNGTLSFVITDKPEIKSLDYGFYISQTPIILNVHHKNYILGRKAWEYKDSDLVTLCNECHLSVHKAIGVKVYADENGFMTEVKLTPCFRCGGTGYFPEYRNVQNGICFRCKGRRFEEYKYGSCDS